MMQNPLLNTLPRLETSAAVSVDDAGAGSAAGASPGRDTEDAGLLTALKNGEEWAFNILLQRHCSALLRLAASFVSTRAAAEEVVQETWLAVFTGVRRFEGRSSLKTWIFRILVNRSITRRNKDGRMVPFSSMEGARGQEGYAEPSSRLSQQESMRLLGRRGSDETPERLLIRKQVRAMIEQELAELPSRQQVVVSLRDLDGWCSREVCEVLGISEANQRVLLHRGRVKLRAALSQRMKSEASLTFAI